MEKFFTTVLVCFIAYWIGYKIFEREPPSPVAPVVEPRQSQSAIAQRLPVLSQPGAPPTDFSAPQKNVTEQKFANQPEDNLVPGLLSASVEARYGELVKEKERQKYLGTDEFVRCRMEIPKKTLGDESDRQAWLKSLREAGGNEQRALVILSEAQCAGGK